MIKIVFFCVMIISINLYAGCGSSYVGSQKRVDQFVKDLKGSLDNSKSFSELFNLPFKIKFNNGKSFSFTKTEELKTYQKKLIKAGLGDLIRNMNSKDVFCNYQGGMISNMWFTAYEENGPIKVVTLNESLAPIKELISSSVSKIPNASSVEIEEFIKLTKNKKNRKILNTIEDEEFEVPEAQSKKSKGILYQGSSSEFRLWYTDINNDGVKEYILAYINSGSGGYSGIQKVIQVEENDFVDIGFEKLNLVKRVENSEVKKSKRAKAWKEHIAPLVPKMFHDRIGDPFLFVKDGKTLINFSENQVNHTYIWEGHNLRLLGVLN